MSSSLDILVTEGLGGMLTEAFDFPGITSDFFVPLALPVGFEGGLSPPIFKPADVDAFDPNPEKKSSLLSLLPVGSKSSSSDHPPLSIALPPPPILASLRDSDANAGAAGCRGCCIGANACFGGAARRGEGVGKGAGACDRPGSSETLPPEVPPGASADATTLPAAQDPRVER